MFKISRVFLLVVAVMASSISYGRSTLMDELAGVMQGATAHAPAGAEDEFGFSPEGSAKTLVLKFVASSTKTLDIMAYAFTSQDITTAVVEAARRGVRVRLVADYAENITEDSSGAAQRALSRLAKAGCEVRLTRAYPIHHDKIMIVDGRHLLNGSFNFTAAAQSRNSENVSVRWNNAKAATIFQGHFESRFDPAIPFPLR